MVNEETLEVADVHCENCVSSIEGAVGSLDGVSAVKVDLERKDVTVRFDSRAVALEKIVAAIEEQGYDVGGSPPLQIGKRPE